VAGPLALGLQQTQNMDYLKHMQPFGSHIGNIMVINNVILCLFKSNVIDTTIEMDTDLLKLVTVGILNHYY
jgi:hypothetical protein